MSRRALITLPVATLVLLAAAARIPAQETSGSGTGAYAVDVIGEFELSDGSTGSQAIHTGFVFGDDPSNPFDNSIQTCAGTSVEAADGSTFAARGYCDGIDGDGDLWWIWWASSPDGGKWGLMGGTGKWVGVRGGGTTQQVAQWPDGRYIITWEGTWTTE
jgi:hypothetical protein